MKVKRFIEPVFIVEVVVIYDATVKEAEAYLKKLKVENVDLEDVAGECGTYLGKRHGFSAKKYYIYLEKIENKEYLQSVIYHETVHLVNRAMADCGIWLDKPTDEVYAYYTEYWLEKIIKATK